MTSTALVPGGGPAAGGWATLPAPAPRPAYGLTGAGSVAEPPAAGLPPGTSAVDVTSYLHRKLAALARHRTQYPITPSMLPRQLLQSMLGTEFFRRVGAGSGNAAASRWATAPRPRRPASRPSPRYLRRHRAPGTHPPHTVAASVHGR